MAGINVLALLVGGVIAMLGFLLTFYALSTFLTGDGSGHVGGWTLLLYGLPSLLLGCEVTRRALRRLRKADSR
jgi:hypothetical protein